MAKYLITGVSSGIGRTLTKELVKDGHQILGIARRRKLLLDLKKELNGSKKFNFFNLDISKPESWKQIVSKIQRIKFIPRVVILNAAVLNNDFSETKRINLTSTKKIFETNFFSNLRAVNELIKLVKPKTKFIFIGSSSAFKGSGEEGIGYSASKAALSNALESLHLKYKNTFDFKIIHLGPVNTDMLPLKSGVYFVTSPYRAARYIIESINSCDHIFYYPRELFFILRLIKLLPSSIYLMILSKIDAHHLNNKK